MPESVLDASALTGRLVVRRRTFSGLLVDVKVSLDGQAAGRLAFNGELQIALEPGEHTLVFGDWIRFEKTILVSDTEPSVWVFTDGLFNARVLSEADFAAHKYDGFVNLPRVHLSTLLICMILFGVFMGLNVHPPTRPWAMVPHPVYPEARTEIVREYGWPLMIRDDYFLTLPPNAGSKRSAEKYWHIEGVLPNLFVAVLTVIGTGWWLERRERKRKR